MVDGRARSRSRSGFTLVEMMVVVIIVALAAGTVTFGLRALTRANLRSACMRVTAASRAAYGRALSQGTTVRVVLDFEKNEISIDEARGALTLARNDDHAREEQEGADEDRAAVDPWEAARANLATTLRPTFGASPFGAIQNDEGEPLRRFAPRPLSDRGDIRVVRLFVPHEPAARESGRGAIHFFPNGRTEHAVVQLTDDGGDTIYSVEIHPLTGRATIRTTPYEPRDMSEDADDEDLSEVRDPG